MAAHLPVLLKPAVDALSIQPDGIYIDGTYGRGGHSAAILKLLGPEGRLFVFDQDPTAIANARQQFGDEPRLVINHTSFTEMEAVIGRQGLAGRINGILLDLGVSSPQLDDAERGFSFTRDGPLDMRMDNSCGITAADWLVSVGEQALADVLYRYGDEKYRGRIARHIVEARAQGKIETTKQLADIVAAAIPRREPGKHPATRSFQAIRIAINNELGALESVLEQSLRLLCGGGRLAVISFHSLEDRIVKRFMRDGTRSEPAGFGSLEAKPARVRIPQRPVRANEEELAENPRARSAVLRVAEQLAVSA